MSQVLNANDADEQLQKLLEAVERGGEVTIEREGVPCARIVPAGPASAPILREAGFLKGHVPGSFFEPLP